jgi:hypothetical protein
MYVNPALKRRATITRPAGALVSASQIKSRASYPVVYSGDRSIFRNLSGANSWRQRDESFIFDTMLSSFG